MSEKKSFSYRGHIVQAILFDLDGTLYNQTKMQMFMIMELFLYYVIRPHKLFELRILYYFRKKRYEADGAENLEQAQYDVTAFFLKVSREEVRRIVTFWIEKRPLKYIKRCRYDYISDLFKYIKVKGLDIAIVSDYPVEQKLKALELHADMLICSTDKEVNSFKPNPDGFLLASHKLGIRPENCIVIGDRDEKDGEGARRAGMIFVEHDKIMSSFFNLIK